MFLCDERNVVFLPVVLNYLTRIYRQHPLKVVLIAALAIRILAAVFSRGYAFTDDHYFVIEEAQQWIFQSAEPRSFFNPNIGIKDRMSHGSLYTTLHYILFQCYRSLGFQNPMHIMLSVRLFHAFYSVLIVYFGFKIARHWGSPKTAIQVAWVLAMGWFMPFLSVRNLTEVVCIPPLMAASYWFLTYPNSRKMLFGVGLLLSLAFALRFQTVLFSGIFGIQLLWNKRIKEALALLVGFGLGSILALGVLDYVLFNIPFHELISYIEYNATHSGEYPNGPWYQYILVILGLFLLFSGGNWLVAMVTRFKRYQAILWPTLVFLVFHSYFPNKQERFILPVIPFIIIAGIGAWNEIVAASKRDRLLRYARFSGRFFWIINIPLVGLLSVASTRTAKMDAMDFLRRQPDAAHFVIESSHNDYMEYMPRFYGNFWTPYQHILPSCGSPCFFDSVSVGVHPMPNYALFFDSTQLPERVRKFNSVYAITPEKTIESSWIDRLIPKLNPVVKSQKIYVYRVGKRNDVP